MGSESRQGSPTCIWQAHTRLRCSAMSCMYTTLGGYSGTSDSDSSTKRWFSGFLHHVLKLVLCFIWQ